LFDTGINSKILLEKLNSINIKPKDIDVVCITHMHYDHIAGLINDYNRTFPKADIYIAKEELDANKNSDLFLAYSNRIKPFKQNETILSFIKTIPAFGHTAGHTMFEITSDNQTVLIWGDVIHAPIQFEEPNIYLTYDSDPISALVVRKKILKDYSDSGKYIAGAHLLNCGIGKIQKDKSGYKFIFVEE
jgi:glyoxylase-like metal-dependent hydrolase (beta-lactamase superfamily II)